MKRFALAAAMLLTISASIPSVPARAPAQDMGSMPMDHGSMNHGGHAGHDMGQGGQSAQDQMSMPMDHAMPSMPAQPQAESASPVISIPQDQQQLIGIRTVPVAREHLKRTIRTVGRVEIDEQKLVTVNVKLEGWIEKLRADYTGRYVKKGEVLAEIYSPEVMAVQHEYLQLLKWRAAPHPGGDQDVEGMLSRDAESLLAAARERLRLLDVGPGLARELERTGKVRRTVPVVSPVSGYVVQKMAVQGMRVMPGEKLFDIADLSTVWVMADIYEYELPMVKVGQPAVVRLSYLGGREFKARVDYVYPSVTSETRTARARLTLPNPGDQIKPQMYTDVSLDIDLGERLVVPDEAIIDTGLRQIAYVEVHPGHFEMREVRLGLKADGRSEVLQGLNEGELVAASANFLIDAETRLKGGAGGGHQH